MGDKKNYSIKEIARIADVSPATVSRVMNKTTYVDDDKKSRVLAAIEQTSYVPNKVARSLFKKSSNIIGFIVPNSANPFFTEIGRYMEQVAFERGYHVIFCNSSDDLDKENEYARNLISMNTDGIVLITNNTKARQEITVPVITIDREFEYENDFLSVSSDHYLGGKLAVEHLYQKGCRKIAYVGGIERLSSAALRHRAYMDFCKEHKLENITIDCQFDFNDGLEKTEYLLEHYSGIDGIIAANDIVALAVYKVLRRHGIDVPNQVKLIGYDNIRESSRVTPALTTIAQPIQEIAEITANNIIDVIEGKEIEFQKVVLSVKCIERETT